jgi:hypothetical protein
MRAEEDGGEELTGGPGLRQDERKCVQLEVGAHLRTPRVESAVTRAVVSLRMT